MHTRASSFSFVCVLVVGGLAVQVRAEQGQDPRVDDVSVRFNRDVRPLLADRCFACHGQDAGARKAQLRLDRADGPDGAYRERRGSHAIQPGSLEESELWARVTSEDPDVRMPPADSHEQPFAGAELELLRRWIEAGAVYEDHWAFVPPARPQTPQVRDGAWARRALDRYVLRQLEEAGLEPSVHAQSRTLIRRVSLDLTGLPPTREEVASFLAEANEDPDGAYERLVERKLAAPQYGEHMARYWLDLVRFADTNGVHHDHYRELSLYRDWVIRAFNENLPFDEFATQQLAGDLYAEPTDEQLVGSGFLRLHRIIDSGTMLPEESLANNVRDRVEAFGTVFLGLTAGCAVCHDHKYDPLAQDEFYALSAFFNNLDGSPETNSGQSDKTRGLQPPYLEFPSAEQRAGLDEIDAGIEAADTELAGLRAEAAEQADATAKQALEASAQQVDQRIGRLRQDRDQLLRDVPAAMVMRERVEVRPANVLVRGDYQTLGPVVTRDTPGFLPPLSPADPALPSRMDLARWLLAPEHPLTARVTVNRFWQQLFGVGLVKTSEDLGIQGEWPSHPELLDHLALEFVDSGWDVKALMRELVLSATYQQSSSASPEDYARDPENRRLARGARFRLDAEVIRDQLLATSGLLDPSMYGRSVKPPQPAGVWEAVTLPSSYPKRYQPDTGAAIVRRSLYTFWKRAMPPVQMSILDAPTREFCTARRERTNTPLQALLLLNEPEYLRAARQLALRALSEHPRSPEERIALIYESITAQLPDEREAAQLAELARGLAASYAADPSLAQSLCAGVAHPPESSASELAAWTMLVSTVYNLDITKTRE